MTTSLLQLRTRARSRADQKAPSTFCSDSEIDSWLNSGLAELYDMVTNAYEDYFTIPASLTISSGNTVALPALFYKLRALDFSLNGQWVELQPFNFNERNRRGTGDYWVPGSGTGRGYRLMGSNLMITPTDNAIGLYQLWYVPAITTLTADGDLVPTILSDAKWDEYIVLYAAERMLSKEESSIVDVSRERSELIGRITKMAADRQVDQSGQVQDVTNNGGWGWNGY